MAISSPEMMLVPDQLSANVQDPSGGAPTKVDIAKATTADLTANTIFVAHTEILLQIERQ